MKALVVIILSFTGLLYASCNTKTDNAPGPNKANIDISKGVEQLANSEVCMINNKFMGKDQIAVKAGNKTYYGCCENCVKTLKEDTTSHFANDPATGVKVDKALAVIIIKPGSKDDVLYFESEANAKKFVKEKN